MTIRPATLADLAALVTLEALCNLTPWSQTQLQATLVSSQHIWLRTDIHNHIVAMLVWQPLVDEAEILRLNTAPTQRRQGHAQALLHALWQTALNQKFTRIVLEVRTSNTPALALYHHFGFIECGLRKGYYAGTEDALLMEKIC